MKKYTKKEDNQDISKNISYYAYTNININACPQQNAITQINSSNNDTAHMNRHQSEAVVVDDEVMAVVAYLPDLCKDENLEEIASVDSDSSILSKSSRILIFIGLQIALLLTAIDRIIITTALPRMTSEFGAAALSTWVATSYMLAITTFMPIFTKLSDIFGRKRIILSGIAIIVIGSLISGFSQTMGVLIAGRAVQGLGAAGNVTMIHIIISDIVPLRQRGIYQSVIDGIYAISYVISPLLGGVFSEYLSWRWVFYINLPLGAISFILLVTWLKLPTVENQENLIDKVKRIDFVGSFFVMACVTVLLLAMSFGGQLYSWNSVPVIFLMILSGILLIIFLVVEAKVPKEPLMPLRILTNRSVLGSFVANTMFGGVYTSTLYFLPNYFQVVKGDDPMKAGIRILPLLLVIPLISISTGVFISRKGVYRYFITASMVLLMVGIGLISRFNTDTPWRIIYGSIAEFGIGAAPMFSSLLISVQAAVPSTDVAVATGVNFLLFDIGAAIGIAITSAILNTKLNQLLQQNTSIPTEFVTIIIKDPVAIRTVLPQQYVEPALDIYAHSIRDAWLVMLALPAIGFLASLFIKHFTLRKKANIDIKDEPKSTFD